MSAREVGQGERDSLEHMSTWTRSTSAVIGAQPVLESYAVC